MKGSLNRLYDAIPLSRFQFPNMQDRFASIEVTPRDGSQKDLPCLSYSRYTQMRKINCSVLSVEFLWILHRKAAVNRAVGDGKLYGDEGRLHGKSNRFYGHDFIFFCGGSRFWFHQTLDEET